jgi:O-antigen ligase
MTWIRRVTWLIILIVFFFALYFLSSRAGILAAIILFPVYLLYKLYKKVSKWIILGALTAIILAFIVIAGTNDRLSYTFEGISLKENLVKVFEKDVRCSIWKSAISVIKHNMVTGVGIGDASTELKKEFINQGYSYGYYNDLNAHNQYLEVLLENGLIGLVIFSCILGYMLFVSISEKNLIYGLFILMILIFFSFESVLNRLAGITFFSLFSFLLIHIKSPGKHNKDCPCENNQG